MEPKHTGSGQYLLLGYTHLNTEGTSLDEYEWSDSQEIFNTILILFYMFFQGNRIGYTPFTVPEVKNIHTV